MVESKIADFFSKFTALDSETKFAVAVSGGPDSMALAHMLSVWAKANDKTLFAMTVDHGLRPEAAEEARQVASWAASQDIAHVILEWRGEKPESGIMEAAREARYALMAEYCKQHDVKTIFVAHHQDDQAETFLIRLAKGSGLDGLAAMGATHIYNDLQIARPLLDVSKEEIIGYCKQNDIPYIDDPSNRNEDYMRPRLRQSMEVLGEEGLTSKRLAMTAKRLGRARKALEDITNQVCNSCIREESPNHVIIDFDILRKQPEEIGLRVVQKLLEKMRTQAPYNVRMEKLEELFESLWCKPETFKPRTLGGYIFSLKEKQSRLHIKQE